MSSVATKDPISGIAYLNSLAQWRGQGGFTLESMSAVMRALDNPQDKIKSVHIAGSNGKGSTAAAMAGILGTSGSRVGLTTSPHLSRLNERIVIDGYAAPDEQISEAAIQVKAASIKLGLELSFFEAITACAFLVFLEEGLDWYVAEVGLGGRLDATNVITHPEVAAIITISLEHQEILGHTLAEIAREKGGIIKPGTPTVIGDLPEEARLEIEATVGKFGGSMVQFGKDFGVRSAQNGSRSSHEYWSRGSKESLILPTSLAGAHQAHNFAVALAMSEVLKFPLGQSSEALRRVHWPARLEAVPFGEGEVIIDSAHNPAGVETLVTYLKTRPAASITIGFGVLQNKDWRAMVHAMVKGLSEFSMNWILFKPDSPMALNPEVVAEELSCIGISSNVCGIDYAAVRRYAFNLKKGEILVLTGSMYMVGALREALGLPERAIWAK